MNMMLFYRRCEIKELSLDMLFGAGPPMYLGFLIHVFLHLVIIRSKIAKQPRDEQNDRNPPSESVVNSVEEGENIQ